MVHRTHRLGPAALLAPVAAAVLTAPLALAFFGAGVGEQHFGLVHQPLGAATLGTSPDGRLTVSNIGSSGEDGVSIDLGESAGFRLEWEPGPPGGLAAGMCTYVYHPYDWRNGCIYVKETGGGSALLGIEGTGAQPSCVTVTLMNGPSVVDSSTFTGTLPPALVTGDIGSDPVTSESVTLNFAKIEWHYEYQLRCPTVQPLAIAGSAAGAQQADRVIISLDGLPPADHHLTHVDVLAANVDGALVIGGEALLRHRGGRESIAQYSSMRALGGASMTGVCGTNICAGCPECCDPPGGLGAVCGVSVSGIGSSGEDGVRLAVDDGDAPWSTVTVDCSGVDPGAGGGGSGGRLALRAAGTFDGMPRHPLGEVGIEFVAAAASYELTADFAPVGSVVATVEVRSGGALQGSVQVPLHPGVPAAVLDGGPAGLRITKCGKFGVDPPCFLACTAEPFTCFAGGEVLVGDDLRILATGATGSVTGVSSFEIGGRDLPPFMCALDGLVDGAPPVLVNGVAASATGGANVAVGDVDGDGIPDLVVSNLGSSGKDGVSIDAGSVQGVGMFFGPGSLPFEGNPRLSVDTEGADGGAGTLSFELVTVSASVADARFSCGDPAATLTIELFGADGQRLLQFEIPDNDLLTVTGTAGATRTVTKFKAGAALAGTVNLAGAGGEPVGGINVSLEQIPGGTMDVSHPSVGTVSDVASMSATCPTSQPVRCASAQCRASDLPSFTIASVALHQFDNDHRALPDTVLHGISCPVGGGFDDHMQVLMLGTDPGDGTLPGGGVVIDALDDDSDDDGIPTETEVVGTSFVLDGSQSIDDGVVQTFTWRQLGGPLVFDTQIGDLSLSLDPGGGSRTVGIDPIPWMAPESLSVTVTVLDDVGNPVSSVSGLSPGPLATSFTPMLPGSYVFELSVSDGSPLSATGDVSPDGFRHVFVWDSQVDLSIAGGPTVQGHGLEIEVDAGPLGPTDDPGDLLAHEIRCEVTGPAAFGINEEGVGRYAPPCPADTNGDAVVDVSDLVNVILQWGQCPAGETCTGDINDDDVIDVGDLVAVILSWGACPGV